MSCRACLLLVPLALLAPALPATGDAKNEKPFPVDKTTILREGKVRYIVEGRLTIPPGVDISCQKDVHIIGRGKDPTIHVEGALKAHAVALREIIFEGVTIELGKEVRDVHLDWCIFRNSGGVVTPEKRAARGKLFMTDVQFIDAARIDVLFAQGNVDLSGVSVSGATRIRGVERETSDKSKVKVAVRGSSLGELHISHVDDATVRLTSLAGSHSEFLDCRSLIFDGNKVNSTSLLFAHSEAGGLAKTKVTKCDIYSGKVSFHTPKKDGRSLDKIVVDRCWFRGETDPKRVRGDVIQDAEDSEENGARVKLGKCLKRPNELAGEVDR